MALIPTVNLYRDGKMCIANECDAAAFAELGWKPEASHEPEQEPEQKAGVYEDTNPTMLDPVGDAKGKSKRIKK